MEKFDKQQFGFRSGSSTLCALLYLDDHITRILDDQTTVGAIVISYDLSKAFDKLPHEKILQRLCDLEFPHSFIEWVTSYLEQRQQYVRIGVHNSQPTNITSGVPQGSILGPLFFVTTVGSYINESNGCVIKYADDTTLCFPILKNDTDYSLTSIYREHERITQWSNRIGLPINRAKSKCMTIKKSKSCPTPSLPNVENVDTLRILGVNFNSKWNADSHIVKIVAVASRRLYALRIMRNSLSKDQMTLVFNSLVRSLIEYCAPLFLGLSSRNSSKLDRLQKRYHQLICGKSCAGSCLQSLGERRELLSLRFLDNVMKPNHILHSLLPHISNSGRFCLPSRRTTKRSLSFFPLICEIYNHSLSR